MKFFKGLLAFIFVVFFLALGAFGGCVAAVGTQSINLVWIGLIGGGLAGLWIGILIARKLFYDDES